MSTTDSEIHAVLARDMLPVSHGRSDHLPPMLFVASLFYALIILGVSFDLGIDLSAPDTTSLEVTIVADSKRNTRRPEDADYLAQANQTGNGNTREQVSAGAAAPAPGQVDVPLERVGPVQVEQTVSEVINTELLTTSSAERAVYEPDDASDAPAEQTQVAQALPAGAEQTLPLPEDENPTLLITDDNPRHLVVSVNSAESDIAPYLNNWKRRVERIGTLNFPRELDLTGLTGSPTLAVSILPDGALSDVRILRTSGHDALDRAAMMVLNRASPFARFPDHVRERYDLLRFAYKFEFRGGDISTTLSSGG
ncbi:MAG: TonB family protein [Pseudomonadota bacterium]